jgi:hypothetical protein
MVSPPHAADASSAEAARSATDTRALPYMLIALAMLGYALIAIGL